MAVLLMIAVLWGMSGLYAMRSTKAIGAALQAGCRSAVVCVLFKVTVSFLLLYCNLPQEEIIQRGHSFRTAGQIFTIGLFM